MLTQYLWYVSDVMFVVVGCVGLAMAGRFAKGRRALAITGSALVTASGAAGIAYLSFGWDLVVDFYGEDNNVYIVVNYILVLLLAAGHVALGVAAARRDSTPAASSRPTEYDSESPAPAYGLPPGADYRPGGPPPGPADASNRNGA